MQSNSSSGRLYLNLSDRVTKQTGYGNESINSRKEKNKTEDKAINKPKKKPTLKREGRNH